MFFLDIIAEGQTEVGGTVADELNFLKNTYDDIKIVRQEGFYPKVLLTLDSEAEPRRRVLLEVSIVGGYPFVAPRVRISFPEGVTLESGNSFTMKEVNQLQIDVKEAISPCLLDGTPCVMQIISVVKKALEESPRRSRTPPPDKSVDPKDRRTPEPYKVERRDVTNLCIFVYHLLHKICHLKDPDSKEEAVCNFESLVHYLSNVLNIVPDKLRKCVPWKYVYIERAFRTIIRDAMDGSDDLAKWLWRNEEDTGTFQHSSVGRYKNEFIQQSMLGSGGFAPVYVCRKKVDGRLYAVKKIVLKTNQSEKALREAQSLAALSHKHIVRYYDAWIEPGCDDGLLEFAENLQDMIGDASSEAHSSSRIKKKNTYNSSGSSHETGRTSERDVSSDDEESSYDSTDEESPPSTSSTPDLASTEEYQTLYIQMELCSKQTLRHIIEKWDKDDSGSENENSVSKKAEKEKMAASILRQLLIVVDYFHRENIVHRDLKPDNILFEMQGSSNGNDIGTIRVADFGLSRTLKPSMRRETSNAFLDDSYKTTSLPHAEQGGAPTGDLGSCLYCAPEQAASENYDFKVDEYSIGMIALEMWLAIAGKGFRDRFLIMDNVNKEQLSDCKERLPGWFLVWNPMMAEIITNLIEKNPDDRRTCADILNTAHLPGDPPEIVDALKAIEQHRERITGRVLHCIQGILVEEYQKPPQILRETVETLTSAVMLNLMRTINVIGLLHAAVPVPCYDLLVPMNPSLSVLDVPCFLDSSSRAWALPSQPQLAIASFLVLKGKTSLETFYQFYHRTRPYVVFTTPVKSSRIFNEMFLDPVLSFLHLLTLIRTKSRVDIIISHARWLNAIKSKEGGSCRPTESLAHMRTVIESSDLVAASVARIDNELIDADLPDIVSERCDLVRRFTSTLLEALSLFERQSAPIGVIIDPALKPSETSVSRPFLENGLFFECRTREEDRPIAFYCSLGDFSSKCGSGGTEVHAVSLSIDLFELKAISERVSFPQNPPLVLDGVAIRQAVHFSLQSGSLLQAAVELWGGNIRACLRLDGKVDEFREAMVSKGIKRVALVGNGVFSLASLTHHRMNVKVDDVPLSELRTLVRKLADEKRAGGSQSSSEVVFLGEVNEMSYSQEARKRYDAMMQKRSSVILVVNSLAEDVEKTISQILSDPAPASFEIPELENWIKKKAPDHVPLPIFSTADETITFFVQKERSKVKNRKDFERRKK